MDKNIGFCSITENICRKEGDCETCSLKHIHENIEHYAKLHEANRLIELPCAVGDTVYHTNEEAIEPYPYVVFSEPFACLVKNLWGKGFFATKEEAEAKLAEKGGAE